MTRVNFIFKFIFSGLVFLLAWIAGPSPAPGQTVLAEIRPTAEVSGDVITLGDLFDNLDHGRDLPVMEAPLPGRRTYVPASYLVRLTRDHGVYWRNSRGVRQVVVTRPGTPVGKAELTTLIQNEVARRQVDRTRQVSLYGTGSKIILPQGFGSQDLVLADLDIDPSSGKFTALIDYPAGQRADGDIATRQARIHGRLDEVTRVPALRAAVAPGTPITRRDITWITVPASLVQRNVVTGTAALLDMTPRRPLQPERLIRQSDLRRPEIVQRGKLVNITYSTAKMTLSVLGKAIENGGRGDVIQVMNTASNKTIEAVVTGPAEVSIITAGSNLAALVR